MPKGIGYGKDKKKKDPFAKGKMSDKEARDRLIKASRKVLGKKMKRVKSK